MLLEKFFTRVAAEVVEHSSGTEAIDLGLSKAVIKDMRNLREKRFGSQLKLTLLLSSLKLLVCKLMLL